MRWYKKMAETTFGDSQTNNNVKNVPEILLLSEYTVWLNFQHDPPIHLFISKAVKELRRDRF